MEIGKDLPLLGSGYVSSHNWNDAVRILNVVRKMNLGQGMRGHMGCGGVSLDMSPIATAAPFPYGNKWVWGLTLENEYPTIKATVWNPLVNRVGMTVTEWFGATPAEPEVTGFPNRNDDLELVIPLGNWATEDTKARTLLYYSYDQQTNAGELLSSKDPKAGANLPVDDGGGTFDAARYIKIPLYILSGVYSSENSTIVGAAIYIDLIHGVHTPNISG